MIVPSTATQNMGNVQRNVLVLDGSQSFAANNNTIIDWNWSLQMHSGQTHWEIVQIVQISVPRTLQREDRAIPAEIPRPVLCEPDRAGR